VSENISEKEYAFAMWDEAKPQTFRQAKKALVTDHMSCTDGTLRAYFSQWKKSHGIQRRYRKSEQADE
jgi:hypothetical protein